MLKHKDEYVLKVNDKPYKLWIDVFEGTQEECKEEQLMYLSDERITLVIGKYRGGVDEET